METWKNEKLIERLKYYDIPLSYTIDGKRRRKTKQKMINDILYFERNENNDNEIYELKYNKYIQRNIPDTIEELMTYRLFNNYSNKLKEITHHITDANNSNNNKYKFLPSSINYLTLQKNGYTIPKINKLSYLPNQLKSIRFKSILVEDFKTPHKLSGVSFDSSYLLFKNKKIKLNNKTNYYNLDIYHKLIKYITYNEHQKIFHSY